MDQRERYRIGLLFNMNVGWMGGIIYILNLIKILNYLDDADKPHILVFYREDLNNFIKNIDYPYCDKIQWKFPDIIHGYIGSLMLQKNIFVEEIEKKFEIDALFPVMDLPVKNKHSAKKISWYADLQHKYYPEFFTKRKRIERDARIRLILKNADKLVVSSKAVENDFRKFFSVPKHLPIQVFHFVSVPESLSGLSIEDVQKKYNLPDHYFMISNQFHKHKNHKVLLEAVALLKRKGKLVHLAMSGKFPDDPNSIYLQKLNELLDKHALRDQVHFLGLIPRDEQLLLMRHGQAVIQPSLFEGWSTVIEDAISLQVPVIAADLPVNIEQLGTKGHFFSPHDADKLATILDDFPERNISDELYQPAEDRIREAAYSFLNIFYPVNQKKQKHAISI